MLIIKIKKTPKNYEVVSAAVLNMIKDKCGYIDTLYVVPCCSM